MSLFSRLQNLVLDLKELCWFTSCTYYLARLLTQACFVSLSAWEETGNVQGYSWPCGGKLVLATICSVKAGGCRKCSRKEHDAFSFWGLKICQYLVLEAVWILEDPSVQVGLFLFDLVANLRKVLWIRFLPLPNSSYIPYCFFDSNLFIFSSLTPPSIPWWRMSWGVCVYFCNFFSFIPHYLSDLRAQMCIVTGGLSFYHRRQKTSPPSSNSCGKRTKTL